MDFQKGLQGLLANGQLGALGAGLLSASGYSTMPQSIGQGLGRGFQNMQQAGLLGQRQQLDQKKLELLKAKQREAEIEANRQADERIARNAAVGQLLQQLPPEQQAVLGPMFDADPGAAMKVAQGLLFPEAPKATDLARKLVEAGYTQGTPEFETAMRSILMKPTGTTVSVSVGGQGGLSQRALTPAEAATLGLPSHEGLIVTDKGEVKSAPKSNIAPMADLSNLLDTLRTKGVEVEDASMMNPINYANLRVEFENLRKMAVAAVAKELLGTPGAEPSPVLYEQAERLVPEVGMLSRKDAFLKAIDTIKGQLNRKRGKSAGPAGVEQRASGYLNPSN